VAGYKISGQDKVTLPTAFIFCWRGRAIRKINKCMESGPISVLPTLVAKYCISLAGAKCPIFI